MKAGERGGRPRRIRRLAKWNCPRCDAPLKWKRLRGWQTYLECRECFSAFELVVERRMEPCGPQSQFTKFLRHTIRLAPGRSRRLKRP